METISRALSRSSLLLVLVAIGGSPIPLASNRDWAVGPLAAIVGVSLLSYTAAIALDRGRSGHLPLSMALAISGMLIVLLWALSRAMPWSSFSGLDDFLASATSELGRPTKQGAIDGERALSTVMRLTTYGGVFWLASQLGRSRSNAAAMTITVVVAAVAITTYGWVMEATTRSCIAVTFVKLPFQNHDPCSFSATFVNSGNFATYAGIASLICVANLHCLLLMSDGSRLPLRQRWRARALALTGSGGIYLVAFVVIAAGLLYTGSKAGVMSFLIAAIAMTGAITRAQTGRASRLFIPLIGLAAFTLMLIPVFGDTLVARYLNLLKYGDPDRMALVEMTLRQIGERPWTGWGPGSFQDMFSVFQPPSLATVYDKAHNVYLENATELGIPAATLLVMVVLMLAWRCLLGLWERGRDLQYPAIGFGATILVGLHSLVDFGIQIPATAITFAAVLGAGWAQSWSSRR